MNNINKGRSPFYPGQPVPVEFFIGRINQIERISRSLNQVGMGKPQAIFLTGEYGIGKSSLAGFMSYYAEKNCNILGIHVFLGDANTLDDVATKTVEAVIKSPACEPTTTENIRNFLSRYIGKQEIFGISINLENLKADSPSISHGFLPFLHGLLDKIKDNNIKGLMLIFDEINGITSNSNFAHFIKALVDENALARNPLPLLLMLCGVEERRREMIKYHQPVERIFDLCEIKPMDRREMTDFFKKTFESVSMNVTDEAMSYLCHYSAGFPKIMHIIGDNIFWINRDNIIDKEDAMQGIFIAAEDVGKKFVDHQIYKELHSKDYHSILAKLGGDKFDMSFQKKQIEKKLTVVEKRKFGDFLRRMKKLKVLKSGKELGEYIFNNRLVRLYLLLESLKKEK